MAGCPLKNFEECPQHNKKGGCEWWIGYTSNSGVTDAKMEGCAVVLQPLLMLENANALGMMEGRINQLSAEMSAGRVENLKEGDALRKQLLHLATGGRDLVEPKHSTGIPSSDQQKQLGA
jgi:hypothetical protein